VLDGLALCGSTPVEGLMEQTRLFRLAVESGTVTFRHEPARGWNVTVTCRRGDETWLEAQTEVYEGLSTAELLDTIYACLDVVL
jgi:hypothetical protein